MLFRSQSALVKKLTLYPDRRGDGTPIEALKDISFLIERGEFATIRGPSDSVKSSMLNIVGCLDKATSGTYRLDPL